MYRALNNIKLSGRIKRFKKKASTHEMAKIQNFQEHALVKNPSLKLAIEALIKAA